MPTTEEPQTLGDVLPDSLKSEYASVLNVSIEEALDIAKYDKPAPADLSEEDIDKIFEIYDLYQGESGEENKGNSAYWNQSEEDNEAYWSTNKDS